MELKFSEKEQQEQWFVKTHRREKLVEKLVPVTYIGVSGYVVKNGQNGMKETQQEHISDIYTQRRVDMLCQCTDESQSPSDTGQFQRRQDWEKEALSRHTESISGTQGSSVCRQCSSPSPCSQCL